MSQLLLSLLRPALHTHQTYFLLISNTASPISCSFPGEGMSILVFVSYSILFFVSIFLPQMNLKSALGISTVVLNCPGLTSMISSPAPHSSSSQFTKADKKLTRILRNCWIHFLCNFPSNRIFIHITLATSRIKYYPRHDSRLHILRHLLLFFGHWTFFCNVSLQLLRSLVAVCSPSWICRASSVYVQSRWYFM